MGVRRQSRELALRFLYSQDFQGMLEKPEKLDIELLPYFSSQLIDEQEERTVREIMQSHDEKAVMQLRILFHLADDEDITGFRITPLEKEADTRAISKNKAGFSAKRLPYAKRLVQGLLPLLPEIDNSISRHSHNWRLSRMSLVDRNILRIAIYEMLYEEDVPPQVAINEALEIARRYSVGDSVPFINGILDSVHTKGPSKSVSASPG